MNEQEDNEYGKLCQKDVDRVGLTSIEKCIVWDHVVTSTRVQAADELAILLDCITNAYRLLEACQEANCGLENSEIYLPAWEVDGRFDQQIDEWLRRVKDGPKLWKDDEKWT